MVPSVACDRRRGVSISVKSGHSVADLRVGLRGSGHHAVPGHLSRNSRVHCVMPDDIRPKRYGPRRQTPSTQSITELDPLVGTWGRGSRLPLSLWILLDAGSLPPAQLRSLDAIHLATMRQLVVTYDSRMTAAATAMGMTTVTPA